MQRTRNLSNIGSKYWYEIVIHIQNFLYFKVVYKVENTGIPCFIVLPSIVHHKYCGFFFFFFNKLKVCGNPALSGDG